MKHDPTGQNAERGKTAHFPADLAALFSLNLLPVLILLILSMAIHLTGMAAGMELPAWWWAGTACALAGVVLLFSAKLPFYRRREFHRFGPHGLDSAHRWRYFLAYALILPGIGMLLLSCLSRG
ncbi:MAG: hypothetical protein EOP87_23320 [Verrucomicrobiaceae bacterium]|nr:MAG: hypothetical protein EOP87_23320 [Verrucomicrobiaceae bacterium]